MRPEVGIRPAVVWNYDPAMALYEITYLIIPPGVGPDDYEPADLEKRTDTLDLQDPEPAGTLPNGVPISYGPAMPLVKARITEQLPAGTNVAILRVDLKRD
ncbi:hypothetical protein ACWCYZ_05835 [Streptomyces virginiae]